MTNIVLWPKSCLFDVFLGHLNRCNVVRKELALERDIVQVVQGCTVESCQQFADLEIKLLDYKLAWCTG